MLTRLDDLWSTTVHVGELSVLQFGVEFTQPTECRPSQYLVRNYVLGLDGYAGNGTRLLLMVGDVERTLELHGRCITIWAQACRTAGSVTLFVQYEYTPHGLLLNRILVKVFNHAA